MGDAFDVARAVDNIRMMLTDPASYPNVAAAGAVIAQAAVDEIATVYSPAEVAALGAEILNGAAGEGGRALAISVREKGMPDVSTPPADPTFGGGGGCTTADLMADCLNLATGDVPFCPGTLGGWCMTVGQGVAGGARLTGTSMRLRADSSLLAPNNRAQVEKLAGAIPNGNYTLTVDFVESTLEVGAGNTFYEFFAVAGGGKGWVLFLDDSGLLIAANDDDLLGFVGSWTPSPGGHHIVTMQIAPDNATPSIFVDSTPIALTPTELGLALILSPNTVLLRFDEGDGIQQDAVMLGAWLTNGAVNVTRSNPFCC